MAPEGFALDNTAQAVLGIKEGGGQALRLDVVRVPAEVDRDAVVDRLAREGIASKPYLPCVHLFPHLRELGYREGQFPVAEEAAARSLALPFFTAISDQQVERVCEALAAALAR